MSVQFTERTREPSASFGNSNKPPASWGLTAVLQNLTYRDIVDWHDRIKYLEIRLESLRRLGMATDLAEAELTQATETLSHLEHHQRVFEYSLRDCNGFLLV